MMLKFDEIVAPLPEPAVFKTACTADFSSAVHWDDDGDLAIAGYHLRRIAESQRERGRKRLAQQRVEQLLDTRTYCKSSNGRRGAS